MRLNLRTKIFLLLVCLTGARIAFLWKSSDFFSSLHAAIASIQIQGSFTTTTTTTTTTELTTRSQPGEKDDDVDEEEVRTTTNSRSNGQTGATRELPNAVSEQEEGHALKAPPKNKRGENNTKTKTQPKEKAAAAAEPTTPAAEEEEAVVVMEKEKEKNIERKEEEEPPKTVRRGRKGGRNKNTQNKAQSKEATITAEPNYSRRLFLGIFTTPEKETRLRNVIRRTYLAWNAKLEKNQWTPKICSLAEFSSSLQNVGDCQIVYAFVANEKFHSKFSKEVDMLFLQKNNRRKRGKNNRVHQLYQYLVESYPGDGDSGSGRNLSSAQVQEQPLEFPFHFVAYTHTRVIVYPDRLWPREMFLPNDNVNSNNINSVSSVYSHPKFYSWGDSETITNNQKGEQQKHDYNLLSFPLLETVLRHPSFHAQVPDEQTQMVMGQIMDSQNTTTSDTTVIHPVRDGMCAVKNNRKGEGALCFSWVRQWDAYKDTHLVTYQDPEEEARIRSNPRIQHTIKTPCRYGPRILLGIFTMKDNEKEINRRAAIRKTYLNYYNTSNQWVTNETQWRTRICSLRNLVSLDPNQDNTLLLRECQMIYVFVAAGNPDGPTEHVDYNTSVPMTLPSPSEEPDLVLLNIKENMEDGKSQSFFKYATQVVDEHVYVEYIVKTDSDTIIYPEHFLNQNINPLPRFPNNIRVYGGSPAAKTGYHQPTGPIYNEGLCYWMSVDLARYITSPSCNRAKLNAGIEDLSMGNFVHSHPLPIHRVQFKPFLPIQFDVKSPGAAIHHPVKQIEEYQAVWRKHVAKQKVKAQQQQQRGQIDIREGQ